MWKSKDWKSTIRTDEIRNGLKERNTDLFINSQMFRQGELSRRNTRWNMFKRWFRQEMQVGSLGMRTTAWRAKPQVAAGKVGLYLTLNAWCQGEEHVSRHVLGWRHLWWLGPDLAGQGLTQWGCSVFLRTIGYSQSCSVSNLTCCLCRKKKDGMFYIRKGLY